MNTSLKGFLDQLQEAMIKPKHIVLISKSLREELTEDQLDEIKERANIKVIPDSTISESKYTAYILPPGFLNYKMEIDYYGKNI